MIKNIVLDIGNVLCTFDPEGMLQQLFSDNHVQEQLNGIYFASLWDQYDKNTLTKGKMIEIGELQAPELKKEIKVLMDDWTQYVELIQENVEYIRHLHDLGYGVYILSNIPQDCFLHLKENGLFKHVDGGVYSYQEKKIKPDFEMYKTLLDRYELDAMECLFIDDLEKNIEAANTLGFHTIRLKEPSQLKKKVSHFLEDE